MNQLAPKRPPFPSGWYSSGGLGSFRPCEATYCRVPYESLPPIPAALLQGTLHWLIPLDRDIQREQQDAFPSRSWDFSPDHWRDIMTSSLERPPMLPLEERFMIKEMYRKGVPFSEIARRKGRDRKTIRSLDGQFH